MNKLLHRIFKGHWPVYEYLGYNNKDKFDNYGDECLECVNE